MTPFSLFRRHGRLWAPLLISLQAALPLAAEPLPTPLPSDSSVEGLGSGWPQTRPAPTETALPPEDLGRLTLPQALEWASQRNPVLRQSYEELVATQNSLGAAYATWWPVINQSINGGQYGARSYYNYPGAFSGGVPSPGAYRDQKAFIGSYFQAIAQFDLTWNLFDPARTPTIWQNKYQVRQAADTYVIARRDNRLQTAQSFIELQQAVAQVLTGQQIVDNDRLLFGLTQSRFNLGSATKVDLAKQESVLKADERNLAQSRQDVFVAQAALAELLAVSNGTAIAPADPLTALGAWPHGLEDTQTSALQYRKVIEQQLMDVKINEAQSQIELAVYRPTIQLINSLLWTKAAGFTSQGPPWTQGARSDLWDASALLQLTFTGFDGGQARMNAEAARSRARAAEASYQASINQVRKEVETFHAQTTLGRQVVIYSSERVKASNEALRLQTLRFNAGYGTVTDVVQAQQDLTQAVIGYVNDLADYNVALVNLSRASGLEYVPDPDLIAKLGTPLENLRLPDVLRRKP